MIVTLGSDFRVQIDKWNHTLEVYEDTVNPQTKAVSKKWKEIGFFPNLLQCINRAAQYKVMSNNEKITFAEYVEQLNRCLSTFTERAKKELS